MDALAAWSSRQGPLVRTEALWRLRPRLGAFGFAQWTPAETTAGVGTRFTW